MEKYIQGQGTGGEPVIIHTRVSENAVVHICTNGLFHGKKNEKAKEEINDYVFDALFWQTLEQLRENL